MNTPSPAQSATSHLELIAQLMDSRVPKSEREHAAAREIEHLRSGISQLYDCYMKTDISARLCDSDLPWYIRRVVELVTHPQNKGAQ